jgi:predicted ATP-grasp superfamily ATP-dependent carboligase
VRILIIGVSTRAIAESAVHAGAVDLTGFLEPVRSGTSTIVRSGASTIITLDYFGDRDQRALVENHALLRDFDLPFSAQSLLQASRHLDFDAVVYISNLENHPEVVEELARGRMLLGNAPATLRQVRDWRTLRAFCREAEIPCPSTILPGEKMPAQVSRVPAADRRRLACPSAGFRPGGSAPSPRPGGVWLRKPIRSGGGHGVLCWEGKALDQNHVLQAYVEGQPASAAFVADGRRSVVIGLTEQMIGRSELGGRGFAWCGNILPLALDRPEQMALLEVVERMAASLTRRFGLRGVNGLDLVVARGQTPPGRGLGAEGASETPAVRSTVRGRLEACPYLVEVNPRYTAAMELVEQAYGLNVFSLHLQAMSGRLPDFSLSGQLHTDGPYFGKGIVYARQNVSVPETEGWTKLDRRDIPFPGEQIEAGHPVCTVLAQGKDRETCWQRLLTAAQAVRQDIGDT